MTHVLPRGRYMDFSQHVQLLVILVIYRKKERKKQREREKERENNNITLFRVEEF